jgi:tRNA (guanine37-N1)-methyltransferase
LEFSAHDLRQWTHDRHNTTDDEPYGGGQGQLMKVEPIFEALDELLGLDGCATHDTYATHDTLSATAACDACAEHASHSATVVCFAPHGQRLDQNVAAELATHERLVLVCGRYEGLDERVYARADAIVSIGDYILTGGELPAMVLTDAVCRLLPGVLGDEMSNVDESFSDGLLEYPQYTRPATYRGLEVPEVLLSGNHARIAAWRRKMSLVRTATLRPDLLDAAPLSAEERSFVASELLKDTRR